jgi:hypothetical protein
MEDIHYGSQRWFNGRGYVCFAGHGDGDGYCATELDDNGQQWREQHVS